MIAALLFAASWIGSWSTAPSSADTHTTFSNVTLREVVHLSAGGHAVRVRLSNRFGDTPIAISAVSIERAQSSASAVGVPGSLRHVTFSNRARVMIPAHADAVSDTVTLPVAPQSDLLVNIYLSAPVESPTYHHLAYQESYAAPGDRTNQTGGDGFIQTYRNWYLLDGIDVTGSTQAGSIATLGDSITNGQGSHLNGNDRWSDDLARRLLAQPPSRQRSVLNEGIDGDRLLLSSPLFGPNALSRFDSDVLSQSGIKGVVVLLGINDIQQTPHQYDPAAIEFALEQIARRAHMRGLRIIGCTITPYEGWMTYQPQGEQTRLAVNRFIRSSGIFDGVADFDAVVRDPKDPHRLRPDYDSGDHLHPSAAAYRLMANAVPLDRL